MRRKYPTSNKKLSVAAVFLVISFTLLAKDKPEETNIICFAAKTQWICAPEDQQEIASEKANKLIDDTGLEQESSQVVIKSINFPKFEPDTSTNNAIVMTKDVETKVITDTNPRESFDDSLNNEDSSSSSISNPYAELWSHQLIGVSTSQSAINYVKKHNLNKNDILIIRSVRKDMDWWVVLYGLYKNKQIGIDNEINLPENINNHWLRPLKNLQVNGFIEKF